MADLLVVPIRLDALCLDAETDAVGPLADFRELPYVDSRTGRDHGSDVPYLSEQLLPEPFQDESFRLKAGVHLHWALPDALTRMGRSVHSRRTVPTQRSAIALAFGTWTGVLMIRAPIEVKIASNAPVNLVSRSRIKNFTASARSPKSISRLRAC